MNGERNSQWTNERPTEPGLYLLQKVGEWVVHLERIRQGRWQDAQNPEWLYCSVIPVKDVNAAWFGPIPEPPNKCP